MSVDLLEVLLVVPSILSIVKTKILLLEKLFAIVRNPLFSRELPVFVLLSEVVLFEHYHLLIDDVSRALHA